MSGAGAWWRDGAIYQIYVRSFADADGDGHGDLGGVLDRLDHVSWLGVDAVWLSPITPSPNADWGYDVSDYTAVDPTLGDLATLDRLIQEAGERGIRVVLDIVPNHTSDRHPWFLDASTGRGSRHRDWYVWADPRDDGEPPNNWRSIFGGSAWSWDEPSGQYYLHNFLPEQPDLNWWNDGVRDAFDRILGFWFDRGVAGLRIDVAHGLVKDRELRDDPPMTDRDDPRWSSTGLRPVYSLNRPEVHDVLRRWRTIAERYDPPRVLIGETWVFDPAQLMRFYGAANDEVQLAMNLPFAFSEFPSQTRAIVESTEAALPARAWPVWFGSNHDVGRFPSRWCGGDPVQIRLALLLLLTLRGTPILYQGDELGMTDVEVPPERVRDPVALRGGPDALGRDGARTPMPWDPAPGAGFTAPGVEPWLPMGDAAGGSVAEQRRDEGSVLHLCRDLLSLRRERSDLRSGAYVPIASSDDVWAYRRGDVVVAAAVSAAGAEIDLGAGTVLRGTDPGRAGERVRAPLRLGPWEAVVFAGSEG
jgi:alpha-glucosidase